jgi:hypothetical protein
MLEQGDLVNQMNPEATYGCDMTTSDMATSDVATIVSTIARSAIRVATDADSLPAGYEQVDVAILRWIFEQGRRSPAGYRTH